MAEMDVELVAVERRIWSGEASFVFARTTDGDIGILPGHEPMLAQLEEAGVVRIDGTNGAAARRSRCTAASCRHPGERHDPGRVRRARRGDRRRPGARGAGPGRRVRARGRGGRDAGPGPAASRRRRPSSRAAGGGGSGSSSPASCCCSVCLLLGHLVWSYGECGSCGAAVWTCACAAAPCRCLGASRGTPRPGWHFGVGRYRGDELAWFRLTSLCARRPPVVRRPHGPGDRRPPLPRRHAEAYAMPHRRRRCCAAARRRAPSWSWRWPRACSPASCRGWRPPRPAARATARPRRPCAAVARSASLAALAAGRHSTSPSGFAARPRMNSRSDSRLR